MHSVNKLFCILLKKTVPQQLSKGPAEQKARSGNM